MKISNIGVTGRLLVLLTLLALVGCSSSATVFKVNTETIGKAEEVIRNGFENNNLFVKNAALSMMRYLDKNDTYSKVIGLFGKFSHGNKYPGFNYLKLTALETLYTLDAEKTLSYLLKYNDYFLTLVDLKRLTDIVGLENLSRFDNIFYYSDPGYVYETPNSHWIFLNKLYAHYYLKTDEEKYKNILTYRMPGNLGPHAMAEIYDFYKNNNLPLNRIIYTTRSLGNVLAPKGLEANYGINASYSLKELLYQALLHRWGVTDRPYKREFLVETDTNEKKLIVMDHTELPTFKYLNTTGALARFYAGTPEKDDNTTIISNFETFQPEIQYEIADTLLHSPKNKMRDDIIYTFLVKQNLYIQRMVVDTWKNSSDTDVPDSLLEVLRGGKDMLVKTAILQGIAARGNKKYLELLEEFIDNPDPLIAVTAAGGYLQLAYQKGDTK